MMRITPAPTDLPLSVYDVARHRFGWLPNTIRVMARGTNAADQYLHAVGRNAESTVPPLARELIAVLVAEENGCDYCCTAHRLAAIALGAPTDPHNPCSLLEPDDPHLRAVVALAQRIVHSRGRLDDIELAQARASEIDDQMIIDIAAVIAENVLGNLINNLAQTELDLVLRKRTAGTVKGQTS
jgi:AhpD family alkylhydroperoxidase